MLSSDSDSMGTVRWITYKCPECDHIFSLSSAIKLTKTKCPSCESEIPLIEYTTEYTKIEPQAVKAKRRKHITKKKKESVINSWDSDGDKKPQKSNIRPMIWVGGFKRPAQSAGLINSRGLHQAFGSTTKPNQNA